MSSSDSTNTLTAAEAARMLGVRRETLYAYVSRGLLRSVEGDDSRRTRLYPRAEVEALKTQREMRRQPAKAALGALHFGSPILESSLTLIEDGRMFYRGRDALGLSRSHRLEEVAGWIWLQDFAADQLFSSPPPSSPPSVRGSSPSRASPSRASRTWSPRPWSLEALQSALPTFAAEDLASWATDRPRDVAAAGARLLLRMTRLAAEDHWRGSIASTLLEGWGASGAAEPSSVQGGPESGSAESSRGVELLDAAMILCADHELNVSTFTARCVASAGSPVASVVSAGLAALQGPEHGGHTRRMEALLREAGRPEELHDVIADRLRRGDPVPGFGQKLYPEGDPRYIELSSRLRRSQRDSGGSAEDIAAWADAIEAAGLELLGEHPTVDVGLVLTARSLDLPRDAALCLFALGRTVGWIGHAIEQYGAGRLIRPRAHYTGPRPS